MADNIDKLSLHIGIKNGTTLFSGLTDVRSNGNLQIFSIGGGNGSGYGGKRFLSGVNSGVHVGQVDYDVKTQTGDVSKLDAGVWAFQA